MKEPKEPNRRAFFTKVAQGVGYSLFGGMVWSAYISQSKANQLILRPPGALKEKDFISTCIKCGLCVEACPFDTLKLATISDNITMGTPYFTPRTTPCYMCTDIPCANACPTTALDIKKLKTHKKLDINKATMGVAVINKDSCLAYWGLQCTMCIKACPLPDEAISLKYDRNERTGLHAMLKPIVHSDVCTGCGLCEHACPTREASIIVLPREIVTAKSSRHYVRGWKEEIDPEDTGIKPDESIMPRTQRNKKSILDNVNDVEGILDE